MAQLIKNPPAMWRPGFDPWVGKIPWRRERLSTPVFWPGEFNGLHSPWGHKESDTTEQLSLTHTTKMDIYNLIYLSLTFHEIALSLLQEKMNDSFVVFPST